KRTVALMFLAPILLLTFLYFVLDSSQSDIRIGVVNAPLSYVERLEKSEAKIVRLSDKEALKAVETGKINAYINVISGKPTIYIDGTNASKSNKIEQIIEKSRMQDFLREDLKTETIYVYGYDDFSLFDGFGSILIGFIVFFFTFLVSGISFLQERTSGTLEKLLSLPIKRSEIVIGYICGFGTFTVLQSIFISFYVIYVLKIMMVGSTLLVLLITLLASISALTLGMLLSTAAKNEFQMIQFIPIVVVPQVFFTGIFDLSPQMAHFGKIMPLYYVGDALDKVMLKGLGIETITHDIQMLVIISGICMVLNILLLKKYRRI
ncbi:MAG: ABC transporter permease, partial [Proteocatella sp.]